MRNDKSHSQCMTLHHYLSPLQACCQTPTHFHLYSDGSTQVLTSLYIERKRTNLLCFVSSPLRQSTATYSYLGVVKGARFTAHTFWTALCFTSSKLETPKSLSR